MNRRGQEVQPQYDVVLAKGHVIDPSQSINQVLDVAISNGRVADIGVDLANQDHVRCLNLEGKYICPGLIDLHGHWYEGSAFGIDPHHCLNTGTTTAVDAGTTGFVNFPEFRRNCIDKADVEVLAFVNIACVGLPTPFIGELEDLRYARPSETASILEKNRDVALGVKIREGSMTGRHGIHALEVAMSAAQMVNLPLMVHVSMGANTREILRRLRPGDIVTHCYQGREDGIFTRPEGHLLEEVIEARKKGIVFDIGHGSGSFSWETAQRAFEHSFYPDTISTDLHRYSIGAPVFDMPTTLSKFLCLGMPLEDVISKSTWIPAKTIGREDYIGTLQPGTVADIFVFEVKTGDFDFVDSHFKTKKGNKKLVPYLTIKGGKEISPGAYQVRLRAYEHCDYDFERMLKETA